MAGIETRVFLGLSVVGVLAGCLAPPAPAASEQPAAAATSAVAEPREPSPSAAPPHFSGQAALARLEVLMGHSRSLGDPKRGDSIEALAEMLRDVGAEQIERRPFRATDPATGRTFDLVNLFGHLRPDAPRRFVVATHFDTRPWADEEADPEAHQTPVPGANDGTSGVAVLLELLPMLVAALPSDVGVTVILFDGEELGHPGAGGYCMGSRSFAERVARERPAWFQNAELGIVLDMVGDRDLRLPIDPGSAAHHPELIDRLWAVAQRRGHTQFVPEHRAYSILDDHEFLARSGVPSVLLIDKEYPPWHTRADTIDQVSAQSLGAVGDTVLHTLLELAAEG
ncbi:MAG: M28 family peptidase [Myxococcota bacterium]